MGQTKLVDVDPGAIVSSSGSSGGVSSTANESANSMVLASISKTQTVAKSTNTFEDRDIAAISGQYQDAADAQLTELAEASALEDDLVSNVGKANTTGSIMGSLATTIASLASTGDVLGMGSVVSKMDALGFDGSSLFKSLAPNGIADLLANFNYEKLYPGITENGLFNLSAQLGSAIVSMDSEWYWLDKDKALHDYKKLSRLSTYSIKVLSLYEDYNQLMGIARSLRGYRTTIEA